MDDSLCISKKEEDDLKIFQSQHHPGHNKSSIFWFVLHCGNDSQPPCMQEVLKSVTFIAKN